MIYLYTDGSSRGNPGPGGYGAILRSHQHEKELTEGFRRPNEDLWRRIVPILKGRDIRFLWIKGHNGHPENERCDELAVLSATGQLGPLLTDVEYERLGK